VRRGREASDFSHSDDALGAQTTGHIQATVVAAFTIQPKTREIVASPGGTDQSGTEHLSRVFGVHAAGVEIRMAFVA